MTLSLIDRAASFATTTAIVDDRGEHTYADLLVDSHRIASALLRGRPSLEGARIAYLVTPGAEHVKLQWGIWRAGGMAVPLCAQHPAPELAYAMERADTELVVADAPHAEPLREVSASLGRGFACTEDLRGSDPSPLPRVDERADALLVFTSGTTGKPKGAVTTHAILTAQIRSIVEAWEWSASDRILHVLPLHHLHGILNALCCALWAGATCEMLPRFNAERVLARVANSSDSPLTLFMAVPTIYTRLIQVCDAAPPATRKAFRHGCQQMRLMVSGSAALPTETLERWERLSGHVLLERYGMTEIGMALGNPLHGPRRPGSVGRPFPDVEVRLVDESGQVVADREPGQIEVRSPATFKGYYRDPCATREAFSPDGWFRTGDVAVVEDGVYRILGRSSVDILKTGGYKVSALEVEEVLRAHPSVEECAVVGVEDPEWGQRIAAAVVLAAGASLELPELRVWLKDRLASYKVPTLLRCLGELPRNPLGKVQKPTLAAGFASPSDAAS